jgi:hypothetical protein
VRLEELGKLKRSSDLNGNRNRDLSAFSILPQLLRYRVPPKRNIEQKTNSVYIFEGRIRDIAMLVLIDRTE